VTHEPDIAAWARRKIVVRDGRILEDTGTPATGVLS
jgi:putative ABC transport system ATP-binding protein